MFFENFVFTLPSALSFIKLPMLSLLKLLKSPPTKILLSLSLCSVVTEPLTLKEKFLLMRPSDPITAICSTLSLFEWPVKIPPTNKWSLDRGKTFNTALLNAFSMGRISSKWSSSLSPGNPLSPSSFILSISDSRSAIDSRSIFSQPRFIVNAKLKTIRIFIFTFISSFVPVTRILIG